MNEVKDIVHIRRIEGREKPVYTNVGVLITKPDGKQSIKLNAIPTEFDGWLSVFPQRGKDAPQEITNVEPF